MMRAFHPTMSGGTMDDKKKKDLKTKDGDLVIGKDNDFETEEAKDQDKKKQS